MIGFLKGEVARVTREGCLLDVGGVGYALQCSRVTLAALPPVGGRTRLSTYLQVRDDALTLYGFATESEQQVFEALIGVPGVGPKAALSVCSVFTADALRRALATDDLATICTVPGIGKKTAQRILIDLKEKLELPDLEIVGSRGDAVAGARAALQHLGYSPSEVRTALGEIAVEEGSVEDVVRAALKVLAGVSA